LRGGEKKQGWNQEKKKDQNGKEERRKKMEMGVVSGGALTRREGLQKVNQNQEWLKASKKGSKGGCRRTTRKKKSERAAPGETEKAASTSPKGRKQSGKDT